MKQECIQVDGLVTNNLSNGAFEVALLDKHGEENGHVIRATLSGKIRSKNIRISTGDKVALEMSVYDLTLGRITWRYNTNMDGTPNPMREKKATNPRKKK